MVKPRDVEALAATIRNVLAAPEQYAEMRARAAEWASHYSIESRANRCALCSLKAGACQSRMSRRCGENRPLF